MSDEFDKKTGSSLPSREDEERFAFQFLARVVRDVVGTEAGSVFILDPASNILWLKASTDLVERAIEIPREGSFAGAVIKSGKPMVVADATLVSGVHRTIDVKTKFHTRNLACVPIVGFKGTQPIGAVQAINKIRDDGHFTPQDVRFMEDVARMLRSHVEQAFIAQRLYDVAGTMGVTVRTGR